MRSSDMLERLHRQWYVSYLLLVFGDEFVTCMHILGSTIAFFFYFLTFISFYFYLICISK